MSVNNLKNIVFPVNFAVPGAKSGFEFAIAGRPMYDYQWIWIMSIIAAFCSAWGIGANDVANSFATSVGSKTLKLWQALLIAAFMEFFGAYLLGGRVTDTIKSGITNVTAFDGHQDILMFGMLLADMVVALWLFLATKWGMPVSTTHSIVGAIVGFSLASPKGVDSVDWVALGQIVGSWFSSPLLAGVISAIFYVTVRQLLMRSANSYNRIWMFFPVVVGITVFINVMFIMIKGGVSKGQGIVASATKYDEGTSVGIAAGVGAGMFLVSAVILGPLFRKWIDALSDEELAVLAHEKGNILLSEKDMALVNQAQAANTDGESSLKSASTETDVVLASGGNLFQRAVRQFKRMYDLDGMDKYIHRVDPNVAKDVKVMDIHNRAERFALRDEMAFSYLQVFTAMFASFAHGANDVANAVGPLAATTAIFENGGVAAAKKSPVPEWILLMGGAALVVGLAMYGHIIIRVMGVKMTKITPVRGFCAELATAFVLVIASFMGMPISSTHTAVGAIVGVGIVEGNYMDARYTVNWKLLLNVFGGWVLTLVWTVAWAFVLMSFVTLAPSQYYPMSKHNCMAFYAPMINVTKGMNSSYQISAVNNSLKIMYGYPHNGAIYTVKGT